MKIFLFRFRVWRREVRSSIVFTSGFLVKLNRLHRFDPSIQSVKISVLSSGPIEVDARSNQANSD
ncbi:hypothetical protein [Leptospira santarosai]|uniref:hypothetical protein n=1 Tax=Leptospira santarosai TaxID=28183 RepID=UPI00062842F9